MADEVLDGGQRAAYLAAIRSGAGLDMAARSIEVGEDEAGFTGTQLRRIRRRDAAFRVEVEEAEQEGVLVYRDRLRATARSRALALDGGSDRILEVELATWVPGYEHLRRNQLRVEGKLEHAIVLDPKVLDSMPLEKLIALRDLIAELGGEIIEGEAEELP